MKDNLLQSCLILILWQLCVAEDNCCKDVLLDVSDQDSDVHILQGGRLGFYKQIGLYGGKAQYKQVDGNNYIFFSAKESLWLTTSDHVGNTSTGITSNYTGNCIDSTSEWQYYNGTDWTTHKNLTARCAKIGDTCCQDIEMLSPAGTNTKDNSSLVYAEEASKTLGKYTAVGTVTGRYIYQHQDMDRYLQFDKTNMNWLVVHQVGSISGFIYHKGGSVCAENSGDQWHVASLENNKTTTSWQHDPCFLVRCVKENTEKDTTTKTATTITITSTQKVEAETTPSSLSSSSTKVDSTESSSSVTEENTETPMAKPLVSDSESAGSPVTAIIVSLGFLVVFTVLAVIFVHRFRTSWRSGSHGKQLVLETFGLHRNNI